MIMDRNNTEIYVTFTSWKKRLHLLPQYVENLVKQTIQPTKYILWLSSDEVKEEDVPKELYNYDCLEIKWIKDNYKSFKKFLTIKAHPDAYNIILDDDRLYPQDIVERLLEKSQKYNDTKVITFYCDLCNELGQPWGKNNNGKLWINDTCVLYPPYTFPMEAFIFFDKIMLKEPLISDECYLMPFIIYNKIDIKCIAKEHSSKGLNELRRIAPYVENSQNSALHKMFDTGERETNKKNELLKRIISQLPKEYKDAWGKAFPKTKKN